MYSAACVSDFACTILGQLYTKYSLKNIDVRLLSEEGYRMNVFFHVRNTQCIAKKRAV